MCTGCNCGAAGGFLYLWCLFRKKGTGMLYPSGKVRAGGSISGTNGTYEPVFLSGIPGKWKYSLGEHAYW